MLQYRGGSFAIPAAKGDLMETKHFTLSRIDGEYAYLVERESGEEIFIALALLPIGANIGDRLVLENLEFSFEI